jgi:uncharacterized protein DUF4054
MPDVFGPIQPAPAVDNFVFDFTSQIGTPGAISSVQWQISVDPVSPVSDPSPVNRLVGPPTFSTTKTSALIGNMLDGCLYIIQTIANIDDGRVLIDTASLQCSKEQLAIIEDDLLTVPEFRAMFPSFANETLYPDVTIQFWIDQAVTMPILNEDRWGQFYNLGISLWVAHVLTLWAFQASRGPTPQLGSGTPNSKSVNGVSISYDTQIGLENNAGWYGSTPYGNMFVYYLRMAGAGPMQIGTGPAGTLNRSGPFGPGSLVFWPRPW